MNNIDKIKVINYRKHILEERDAAINRNIINKLDRQIRRILSKEKE